MEFSCGLECAILRSQLIQPYAKYFKFYLHCGILISNTTVPSDVDISTVYHFVTLCVCAREHKPMPISQFKSSVILIQLKFGAIVCLPQLLCCHMHCFALSLSPQSVFYSLFFCRFIDVKSLHQIFYYYLYKKKKRKSTLFALFYKSQSLVNTLWVT